MRTLPPSSDVAVVGAGAAGLAAAIFIRRAAPGPCRSSCSMAPSSPGAKILVSGGGRCNVTNTVVTERDFWGGRPDDRAPRAARASGRRHGRVLPRTRRRRCTRRRTASSFPTPTARATCSTRCCARATGRRRRRWRRAIASSASTRANGRIRGRHLARSAARAARSCSRPADGRCRRRGSDGAGYEIARALGHTIVAHHAGAGAAAPRRPTPSIASTPACPGCRQSTVEIASGSTARVARAPAGRAALDALRHQRPGRAERVAPLGPRPARERAARVSRSTSVPAGSFDERRRATCSVPPQRVRRRAAHRRSQRAAGLRLPTRRCRRSSSIDGELDRSAHLTRDDRRRLSHALIEWPLPVDRHARLQLRRGDRRRRRARRDRSGDDGVARVPGAVPRRRDPRRRRPDRRLQLPVGVVERLRGRACAGEKNRRVTLIPCLPIACLPCCPPKLTTSEEVVDWDGQR